MISEGRVGRIFYNSCLPLAFLSFEHDETIDVDRASTTFFWSPATRGEKLLKTTHICVSKLFVLEDSSGRSRERTRPLGALHVKGD